MNNHLKIVSPVTGPFSIAYSYGKFIDEGLMLRITQMDGSVDGNKPLARVDLWPVTWYAQRSGYLVWSLLSSPIPISSAHHILAYLNISQFSHHFQLLGGWKTILKNMSSSMGRMTSIHMMENKSHLWNHHAQWLIIDGFFLFYPHKITISLGKSPYDVTTMRSPAVVVSGESIPIIQVAY